ncbi:uncharacterized protein [Macrobrachium rosenbergii]|uniref:uncharacterized protein n=1 Tax=Macrobrachium rosenbergii TaxID=79674 RepID=UPI0034D73991
MKPYAPVRSKGKFNGNGDCEIGPGIYKQSYDKYLTFSLEEPNCDIFNVYRDILKCCGREPKISPEGKGKLTVESTSAKESENLKSLSRLGGVKVECAVHAYWNHSKGMIFAPQLMTYSEEKLVEELKDQGVIKIERMKKKVNEALVPLPNLIITFNSTRLPNIVKAAWLRFKVKQYIPRPRRCFHCQEFGHMLGSCRQKLQGKPAICVRCSEPEHGICNKHARCVHCGENHHLQ